MEIKIKLKLKLKTSGLSIVLNISPRNRLPLGYYSTGVFIPR